MKRRTAKGKRWTAEGIRATLTCRWRRLSGLELARCGQLRASATLPVSPLTCSAQVELGRRCCANSPSAAQLRALPQLVGRLVGAPANKLPKRQQATDDRSIRRCCCCRFTTNYLHGAPEASSPPRPSWLAQPRARIPARPAPIWRQEMGRLRHTIAQVALNSAIARLLKRSKLESALLASSRQLSGGTGELLGGSSCVAG